MVPVEDNDENYIHPRESSPLPGEKGKHLEMEALESLWEVVQQ